MTPPPERPTLSLVLPTYNERANLPLVLGRLVRCLEATGASFEIVVVDDDSPDRTWELAEQMAADDGRIRVVRRRDERGLATAVVAGWRHARGRILGVMDADLQYRPESLPAMLAALDDPRVDVAIGSRYAPGATVEEWGPQRWVISLVARLLARVALPEALGAVLDPGAGYFLMRRRVVEGVELQPQGFKILIEVLARGRYDGVVEVGQQYEGRKEGQSKLRGRQITEYLSQLLELSRATGEMRRSLAYAGAGLSGVAVYVGLLAGLTERLHLPTLGAGAVAAEAAILTTFAWREILGTGYAVPGAGAPPTLLGRLARWHRRRLPGGAAGLAVLWAATGWLGVPALRAALAAVAINAAVNHGAGARLRQPRPVRSLLPPSVAPSSMPMN
jgi:dolichol-phosphate mannosyltransferase